MNKVILTGNCVAKPELRVTQNNTDVATFTIAVNEKIKEEVQTQFINCTMFGKRANVLNEYCDKGSKLLIEGSIKNSSYEKDGIKKYTTNIIVNNFEFLGGKIDTTSIKEASKNETKSDPYTEFGNSIEIDSSMLPF